MEEIEKIIKSGKIFEIKVITKSSVNKIYFKNNIIKVKIREIPENGKANKRNRHYAVTKRILFPFQAV